MAERSREADGVRVGVDIGGTFTDLVVALPDGRLLLRKTSSTPDDPGRAVVEGLAGLLAENRIAASSVIEVVHGTTVASNCILEMKGARTGLLTTRGFRDILEIGRIRTPTMFDLAWKKPQPLVPRRLRLEAGGRIGADGAEVEPLDRSSVAAAAERFKAEGVGSVAICFINSYCNPDHEREAEAMLRNLCPGVNVTASYDVLPEIKEYERTSTTVVNAYIQPSMRRYIENLSRGLRGIGVKAPLLVVTSNGGVVGAEAAGAKPVVAVGSGPAAGVVGTARLGEAIGDPDLIAFDMGGTTAKASLIEGNQLSLTTEVEFREGISTSSRFIKAGGYMLKVPSIDVAEVGSGAGSIAWIDAGGMLNVGPQSAGADPGPACYGLNGDRPTVTDANVVLGYLNPETLAGGSLRVHPALAEEAIRRHVAEPLGLDVPEAAYGIRRVVNTNMARAIRSVTIERGHDPRLFTLVAFGGSGPVHAAELARSLDIGRIIVPVLPGVFTAVGMLTSDIQHHFVRTHPMPLEAASLERVRAIAEALRHEAVATLEVEGYRGDDAVDIRFQADLRYFGQGSELTIPLAGGTLGAEALADLRAAFLEEYQRTFGHVADDQVEVVNLRAVASGRRSTRLRFDEITRDSGSAGKPVGERGVRFGRDDGFVPTPVFARRGLPAEAIAGPAIIESYDSTVAVPPGCRCRGDETGNLIIEIGSAGRT